MKRLAALSLLALVLTACGGGGDPQPRAATPPAPTKAQLAAQRLLGELRAEPGDCGCTSEGRARERIADGRAIAREDGYVLTP